MDPTTLDPAGSFYTGIYLGVRTAALAFLPAAAAGCTEPQVEMLALPEPEQAMHDRVLRALRSVDLCADRIAAHCSKRSDHCIHTVHQPDLIAVSGYPQQNNRVRLILAVETGVLLRREFARRGWCVCEAPLPLLPEFTSEPGSKSTAGGKAQARLVPHPAAWMRGRPTAWGARTAALALARIARGIRQPETLTARQRDALAMFLGAEAALR